MHSQVVTLIDQGILAADEDGVIQPVMQPSQLSSLVEQPISSTKKKIVPQMLDLNDALEAIS